MKVGIIGSGGREHSMCLSLSYSKIDKILFFANTGTAEIAENINIDVNNFEKLKIY